MGIENKKKKETKLQAAIITDIDKENRVVTFGPIEKIDDAGIDNFTNHVANDEVFFEDDAGQMQYMRKGLECEIELRDDGHFYIIGTNQRV